MPRCCEVGMQLKSSWPWQQLFPTWSSFWPVGVPELELLAQEQRPLCTRTRIWLKNNIYWCVSSARSSLHSSFRFACSHSASNRTQNWRIQSGNGFSIWWFTNWSNLWLWFTSLLCPSADMTMKRLASTSACQFSITALEYSSSLWALSSRLVPTSSFLALWRPKYSSCTSHLSWFTQFCSPCGFSWSF